jgi:hypothetical protein
MLLLCPEIMGSGGKNYGAYWLDFIFLVDLHSETTIVLKA